MPLFVSHSRVNSGYALRLADELQQRQVEAWLDIRNLAPGAEWEKSVTAAIRDATGFLFIIGPPGPADRWQMFEWQQIVNFEYYLDVKKPLIPVLIGRPDVPGFLGTRRTLLLEETPDSLRQVAESIVSTIRDPISSIDTRKLKSGIEARSKALQDFRRYSQSLAEEDVKAAAIRALK